MSTGELSSWSPEDHRRQRRFRGLATTSGHLHGLRFEGSVDRLLESLGALGVNLTREPVESGPPSERFLGLLATIGTRWIDVLERRRGDMLTLALAIALSRQGARALLYDYRFDDGCLEHTLVVDGQVEDRFAVDPPDDLRAALDRIEVRYEELGMRDWGMTLDDLLARRLPVSPQLIEEAWLLDLVVEAPR